MAVVINVEIAIDSDGKDGSLNQKNVPLCSSRTFIPSPQRVNGNSSGEGVLAKANVLKKSVELNSSFVNISKTD